MRPHVDRRASIPRVDTGRRRFIRRVTAGLTVAPLAAEWSGEARTRVGPQAAPLARFPFLPSVRRYAVGDYLPKDQGGKFIQMEVFGTEDDAAIVRQIGAGRLQAVYGSPLGWSAFERTAIEKSVWLNRFYHLPSFARLYALTGDDRYVAEMMAFIRQWTRENPFGPDAPRTTSNWRDMQVAWRAIHLSWCYFLGFDALGAGDRRLIVDALRTHADILLDGFGRQPLSEFNHQSHGALAMLYLGTLFPELESAARLREAALRILQHHVAKAFHGDGGNVEQMFGYYPFVTHVFRDAYLLCRAHGLPEPDGLRPLLERMLVYLSTVAQPDGTMPPVNDSFDMPAGPTMETLREALGLPPPPAPGSRVFDDTQIAVLRRPATSWYLLANPASAIGAHAHAGRLGFTLWHDGRPVFVDSGCSSYDDPALVTWYRTSRAHNTVLIDGTTDAATSGSLLWVARRLTSNRVVEWRDTAEYTFCRMVSPATEPTNASVEWHRSLVLVKDRFALIHDEFVGAGRHRYELLFHLSADEAAEPSGGGSFRIGAPPRMAIAFASQPLVLQTAIEPGQVSVRGVTKPAPVIVVRLEGDDRVHVVTVAVPVQHAGSALAVTQAATADGVEVRIEAAATPPTGVFLRRPGPGVVSFRNRPVEQPVVVF